TRRTKGPTSCPRRDTSQESVASAPSPALPSAMTSATLRPQRCTRQRPIVAAPVKIAYVNSPVRMSGCRSSARTTSPGTQTALARAPCCDRGDPESRRAAALERPRRPPARHVPERRHARLVSGPFLELLRAEVPDTAEPFVAERVFLPLLRDQRPFDRRCPFG